MTSSRILTRLYQPSLRREQGLTLLEMLVSLCILATVVAGVAIMVDSASEDTRASVTALHIKTVGNAASEYIKDNYAAVAGVATPTTPALVRVPDLISQGYLPAGFSVANPRGQATCVLVLEPTVNKLVALVVTEGGDVIDDLTLGKIAATVGGAGGAVYSGDPNTIRGAMGGYSLPIGSFGNANSLGQRCDGSVGIPALTKGHLAMAIWFGDSAQAASTLYRDAVPSNPALNTMNTPILMGMGAVQSEGSSCTTVGAISRDSAGAVLACDSGFWRRGGSAYWQDAVETFAALPACNVVSLGQTRVVRNPTSGVGARAYTCNGAGSWEPLGVDNSGNLTVAGAATISKVQGDLEIGVIAIAGRPCSPSGRIARDSAGAVLSCRSGVWSTQVEVVVRTADGPASNFYRNAVGTSSCAADEKVVSGGATCNSWRGTAFVIASYPSGNGWVALCGDIYASMNSVTVYAVCGQ